MAYLFLVRPHERYLGLSRPHCHPRMLARRRMVLDWGAHSHINSLTLLHPYASVLAGGIAVAFWLVILTGMWFFQRWARLIFVLLVAVALLTSLFRPHHYSLSLPHSFEAAIGAFVLLLTGAIIAMSFLPPVRDCFATNKA